MFSWTWDTPFGAMLFNDKSNHTKWPEVPGKETCMLPLSQCVLRTLNQCLLTASSHAGQPKSEGRVILKLASSRAVDRQEGQREQVCSLLRQGRSQNMSPVGSPHMSLERARTNSGRASQGSLLAQRMKEHIEWHATTNDV